MGLSLKRVLHKTLPYHSSLIEFKEKHFNTFVKQLPNIISWVQHSNDFIYDVMIEHIPEIIQESKEKQKVGFILAYSSHWRQFDVTITRIRNTVFTTIARSLDNYE